MEVGIGAGYSPFGSSAVGLGLEETVVTGFSGVVGGWGDTGPVDPLPVTEILGRFSYKSAPV
jgi:hypothetical protein